MHANLNYTLHWIAFEDFHALYQVACAKGAPHLPSEFQIDPWFLFFCLFWNCPSARKSELHTTLNCFWRFPCIISSYLVPKEHPTCHLNFKLVHDSCFSVFSRTASVHANLNCTLHWIAFEDFHALYQVACAKAALWGLWHLPSKFQIGPWFLFFCLFWNCPSARKFELHTTLNCFWRFPCIISSYLVPKEHPTCHLNFKLVHDSCFSVFSTNASVL